MADISAKQVHALRARTGLAMMDCKKALVEANGDEDQAMEVLRKKFADKMNDRADKEMANGRIGVFAGETGAAMAELRCETDFVATNDSFKELADNFAKQCVASGETDVEAYKQTKVDSGQTVQEVLVDAFGRLKENMSISRLAKLDGAGAAYVHHNGRVGAVIVGDNPPGDAGRQICMHIASNTTLVGLSRDNVDANEVAAAKDKATGEAAGKTGSGD